MVIDFHTHTFPEKIAAGAVAGLRRSGGVKSFSDGTAAGLSASMKRSGIDLAVNLPVMTRPDQVPHVNGSLIRRFDELRGAGIVTFGGMHPLYDGWADEIKALAAAGIPGIKLHPAFAGIDANDIRFKRIVGAAADAGLTVLYHCGEDVSFPGHNYATVDMMLDVIDDVAPPKLVLAHMGGWQHWDEVKEKLAGAPVWLDTAYSIGPVVPDDEYAEGEGEPKKKPGFAYNLSPGGFAELARAHGTDRVLFATDSPWADGAEYLGFIRSSGLCRDEIDRILGSNAEELLGPAVHS